MMRLLPITYEFMGLAFRNKLVQKTFKAYLNYYLELLIPVIQHGIDTGGIPAPQTQRKLPLRWEPSWKGPACCGSTITHWSSLKNISARG